MAKKQLKKLNQPKKYLQGGSNMGSVSMMRQNPYYLGQVSKDAADAKLEETRQQAMDVRQTAVQAKADAKAQQEAEMDQAVQQSVGALGQAAVADKKAGNLGKLFIKAAPSGAGAVAMKEVPQGIINASNASTGLSASYTPATSAAATWAPIAGSTAAPSAATIGQAGQMVNPVFTSAGGEAATQMVVGQAAPTMSTVGAAPITGSANIASTGTGAASTTAGGLSGVASAGIGIAANIGGTIIRNRTNDDSAYTFTDKERRGNTAGRMLSSAGTGFGVGNAIIPGVGGAIGAVVGAGIGAIKARKENKAAEEEAKRLGREQDAIAGAYQSARVNSMLTGIDTGFGLNSSFNPNTKATNYYQVARTGGITGIQEDRRTKRVPGGKIVPIEGTDAVEFIGRSHEKGGVTIDKNTEVEGGETMDQVAMNNNNKQDYIFSKYLKLGGKSFAERHKEILKGSGSQAEIQQLAAMQEKMAGRNPQQVAQYGGIHKYAAGGFTDPPSDAWKKIAAEYIAKKEGFLDKGRWDENAYRAGYGSDRILRDGKLIPVTKGMVVTKEEALATLEAYSIDKYSNQIAKDLGQENWDKLNDNQRAALTSLGYNAGAAFISKRGYGRKIKYYIEAGNLDAAGDVIYSHGPKSGARSGYLPALEKRRKEESNLFNSTSSQTSTQPVKKTLLPPPPVSADVVPPTFAQRNSLPGVASMKINEEIETPEQSKSNIVFDPTMTRQERLEKEKPAAYTINEQVPMEYTDKTPNERKKEREERRNSKQYNDEFMSSLYAMGYKEKIKNSVKSIKDMPNVDKSVKKDIIKQLKSGNAIELLKGTVAFEQLIGKPIPTVDELKATYENTTGVKPDLNANASTDAQAVADAQAAVAKQNGTANAPAETAYNAATGVKPNINGNPSAITDAEKKQAMDQVAAATNGGPGGTAPTINNQNSTYQNVATTPGYLDYNDPNTAGGIWSGDRYEKEWKPLVGSTMADAAKADQVINYLTNYTGADADDVKAKLKGKNRAEQIAIINDLATDTKVGPFHNAVYGAINSANDPGVNVATNSPPANTGSGSGTTTNTGTTTGTGTTTRKYTPCPPGTYLSTDGTCKDTPEYSKPYSGNLVAAIGAGAQLIPPIYAALKPYQKVGPIAGAPGIKGAILGRENMNQERATSREMNTAINQEVTNNNTGAAGFAIRQAAMAAANKQMLEIANAESKANIDLRGKEAVLGQDASKFNAENLMKAQMYNADLAQRQNQYIDERNIGVVDAAANRLAGMANTYNQYKATDHLARVTNANTHSLERDKMYESLLKDSQKQNSQFNGATDAELRRIAAGLVEEQMGGVGRTGGVRQYISRLGELKSARATKAKL